MRRPILATAGLLAAFLAAGCQPFQDGIAGNAPSKGELARALTGTWDGVYHYPAKDLRGQPVGRPPVAFRVNIKCTGSTFAGRLVETARGEELRAAVRGNVRADGSVLFTKEPADPKAAVKLVVYLGRLDERHGTIRGTWTIPGNWGGRFEMRRQPPAE